MYNSLDVDEIVNKVLPHQMLQLNLKHDKNTDTKGTDKTGGIGGIDKIRGIGGIGGTDKTRGADKNISLQIFDSNISPTKLDDFKKYQKETQKLTARHKQFIPPELADFSLPIPKISKFPLIPNFPVSQSIGITTKDKLKHSNSEIRREAVEELEAKLSLLIGKCHPEITNDLRYRSFQLNAESINNFIDSGGIFDANYQNSMNCLVDSLIYKYDEYNSNHIPDGRLRAFIDEIKLIGNPSAYGNVFGLSSNKHAMFAVKIANAHKSNNNLNHEAFVGLVALNKLRYKIPNFMHTYGIYHCNPPIINGTNIISWCPSPTPNSTNKIYLVLENIKDSKSLFEISKHIDQQQTLEIFLQIYNALNVANKEFDFTHYDLHANNVLITLLPYYISIPLYIGNSVLYLKTRHLARIIDYGMAHIKLGEYSFGLYGKEHRGIYPERSYPMYDVLRILLSTYSDIFVKNLVTPLISETYNSIFRFFNKNDIGQMLNYTFDELVYGDAINKDLDDLIIYVLSLCDESFINNEVFADTIPAICEDTCVDWSEFNDIIFDRKKLPTTLYDFFATMQTFKYVIDKDSVNKTEEWLKQFDPYSAYMKEYRNFYFNFQNNILDLKHIIIPDLYGISFNTEMYINTLKIFIEMLRRLNEDITWINAAIFSLRYVNSYEKIKEEIDTCRNIVTAIKGDITKNITLVKNNLSNAYVLHVNFSSEQLTYNNILLNYKINSING